MLRKSGLLLIFMAVCLSAMVQASAAKEGLPSPLQLGGILQGSAIWVDYKARFLDESGRIIDTGNDRISHSEGQGYGMLLAVAAADHAAFEAIWSWTNTHLFVRKDRLAAWKWTGSAAQALDSNNASDGDILIAWALAEAADFWDNPAYFSEGRAITEDIVGTSLSSANAYGAILAPSSHGFSASERSDGPVVNLSYWIFPAFSRLAQVEPEYDWRGLTQAGLALLDKARFGSSQLPRDWLSLGPQSVAPAEGFAARFGYDAVRIPLYMFWADAANAERAGFFAKAWPANSQPSLVNFNRNSDGKSNVALKEPGYRAVAALARCAASNLPYPDDFYHFTNNQNYYPATLHLLSLMAARTQGGACLDYSKMRNVLSDAWRPRQGSLAKFASIALAVRATNEGLIQKAVITLSKTPPAQGQEQIQNVAEEDAGLVFYLRIAGGVLVCVAAVIWLLRRRGAPAPESWVDDKEELVTEAMTAIGPAIDKSQFALAPRTLPHSPFTPSTDLAMLGKQIEIAATACVRLSRTIGLIYFEIPSFSVLETIHGSAEAEARIEMLAEELRQALRATDHVAVLNRNQIVVCICLLANASDLKSIAGRLYTVAQRQDLGDNDEPPPFSPGYAVYPLNGYEGLSLIDAAREDFQLQSSQKEISQAVEEEVTPLHAGSAFVRKRRKVFRKKTPSIKPPTN